MAIRADHGQVLDCCGKCDLVGVGAEHGAASEQPGDLLTRDGVPLEDVHQVAQHLAGDEQRPGPVGPRHVEAFPANVDDDEGANFAGAKEPDELGALTGWHAIV